ncbi:MAG: ExbD/TolR family protein [Pseudodonghicola sp.]
MDGLAPARKRRRPSLTPMIDVVFLLLVFFMLASRFGVDQILPLVTGGGAGAYSGPPRLVDIAPGGVAPNGRAVAPETLAQALVPLMTAPGDTIILRPRDGATLQQVVAVADRLRAAGFGALVLVD